MSKNLKRIIAFDFGLKRIGVAISDQLQIGAYPLDTFANDNSLIGKLKKVKSEFEIETILLGIPKKFSAEAHEMEKHILNFKSALEKIFMLEVKLVEEFFTSAIAQRFVNESVTKKKKRKDKGLVDRQAAAILIEDFIRKRNHFSEL